jgi:hypothetical protein
MFLYFCPNVKSGSLDVVEAHGLRYATDAAMSSREVFQSPAKCPGVILTRTGTVAPDRQVYAPNKQTWRKIPGSSAWVGRWNEDVIKPADLQRPDQCEGPLITMADGQAWRIAQARKYIVDDQATIYYCPLPHDLDLNDAGDWQRSRVANPYRHLSELADKFWEAHSTTLANESDTFHFAELDQLCIASLTANYYVAASEIALLGAYGVQCRRTVYTACLDLDFARTMMQKKTDEVQDGSASQPGAELTNAAS